MVTPDIQKNASARILMPQKRQVSEWGKNEMVNPEIKKMKKCELHAHLDGSMRIGTMIDIAKKEGITLPSQDPYLLYKKIKFYNGMDLKTCLKSFGVTLKTMQSAYALERIAYELCEDLRKD